MTINRNRVLLRIFKNKLAYVGMLGCLIILLIALLAPLIAPYSPSEQSMLRRFELPGAEYLFGTDQFGRDIFSRVVYGTRVSTYISLSTIIISLVVGSLIGVIAGYKGGWVEMLAMEYANIFLAFPTIVMGIVVLVAIGSGESNVIISLSLAFIPRFIRLARASTLSVKEQVFVLAAQASGVSDCAIMFRHILPNVIGSSIVSAALWTATVIRAESELSFLGLGVQPPTPSWGNMISDGLLYILGDPGLALYPALAIIFAVLVFNMLGDAIRDYLDPRVYV
jgi:peptide/nickel transport system permease protein